MKPRIRVRSIGGASAIRIFIIISILAITAAFYWNGGAAVLALPANAAAAPQILSGETITVTTLEDVTDFTGAQQVGDLPGPDGRVSFREACIAANNTAGPQTIAFAIPVSEFWLDPNVALLKLEQGAFFIRDNETTVDFSTQTINIGDTNPNGPEVGVYGLEPNGWGIAAIFVNGDNNIIKGLGISYQRGYAVELVGDNNRVIGCQISGPLNAAVNIEGYLGGAIPMGNIIGGSAPGEGNTLAGFTIRGPADDNVVIGNSIIGGIVVIGATSGIAEQCCRLWAVEGADFVFCAIRVGQLEGRVVDEDVPLGLGVLGQETTGPGGICFALRTIPVMVRLAETIREHAPNAWLINFTNPAGMVTEAVQQVLATYGWQINTAFVERLNLSLRQHVAAIGRRVSTLCKGEDGVRQQLGLYHVYYNFCLPHASLRHPLLQPEPTHGTGSAKCWQPRTPAMAAGLTDHVWTLREVLLFRVPPRPQPAGV